VNAAGRRDEAVDGVDVVGTAPLGVMVSPEGDDPGASPDEGSGDDTGCPRSAGHLPTSIATLQTVGSCKARVALMPVVAGSPLPTVCRSWHRHTGLLATTLPNEVQHSPVGGVVSFAITYGKHDCSNAYSLEQSIDCSGAGAVIGAAGAGTGACAGARPKGLLRSVEHLEVFAAT
jgi:hypothetical protein